MVVVQYPQYLQYQNQGGKFSINFIILQILLINVFSDTLSVYVRQFYLVDYLWFVLYFLIFKVMGLLKMGQDFLSLVLGI